MRAFFGIGVRMRSSEKADRPGREADFRTPVRRKADIYKNHRLCILIGQINKKILAIVDSH